MNKSTERDKADVVVIDDDEAARLSIGQMLKLRHYKVEVFSSALDALAWRDLPNVDCVISDVKMPLMDGEEFLAEVIRQGYPTPVIMLTGHGDIPMAVRCLKAGAYDFVEKPFEDEVLLACVARAVEKTALRRESNELRKRLNVLPRDEDGRFGMVGRSRVMQDLYDQIEIFAKSDASVLIRGETGAGKELVARAIHSQSSRSGGPFVPANAGAMPETMLESELFGHDRGAFTGATSSRDGKLVTASGGTLLLDEIEGLSERAQIQLLRVLEDGLVQPLGKDKPKKVNVRLLTTTKVDLTELIKHGRMREDFYHRIAVLSIVIPPLRERSEDIPLLITYFLGQAADKNRLEVPEIPEKTLLEMMRYTWPGNVRELKNAVERMLITSHIGVAGPFKSDENFDSTRLISLPATAGRLRDEMEKTEKSLIESTLRENRGEINATSRVLGISRRALYERMKKYELHKEDFKN